MCHSHGLQSSNAYNMCDVARLQPWVLLFGVVEGAWGASMWPFNGEGVMDERKSWMRGSRG
jgi:hypothetical protein